MTLYHFGQKHCWEKEESVMGTVSIWEDEKVLEMVMVAEEYECAWCH